TKVGVNLYWPFDDYMLSDAYDFEFDPTTGATEPIVGRRCWYLTHAGTRMLILIDRGEWTSLQQAMQSGESIDPALRTSLVVDEWYTARCPLTFKFAM
ncbi:MAG TPA: hypothetical protein VFO00_05360, partial [Vitreimonas sp.]|nr:hypothetical protein [Vitreimonas sp.]